MPQAHWPSAFYLGFTAYLSPQVDPMAAARARVAYPARQLERQSLSSPTTIA